MSGSEHWFDPEAASESCRACRILAESLVRCQEVSPKVGATSLGSNQGLPPPVCHVKDVVPAAFSCHNASNYCEQQRKPTNTLGSLRL